MFRTQLKIILRTLWKSRSFTLINLSGLALGMAACLLILQYVSFQLSFDQFNSQVSDIYRVYNDRYQNGKLIQHGTITYSGISAAMQKDFPEVVDHVRVVPNGEAILINGNKKLSEDQILYVEPSFLRIFSYPLVAGDTTTALKGPYTAVLSEKLASRLFSYSGSDFSRFLGKSFLMGGDSTPYKITGICQDVSENSHLSFNLLISYRTLNSGWKESIYDFTDSDFWHYILLRHGTDPKKIEARLAAFSQKYFQGNKVSGSVEKFHLQPLTRAHLYSDFEYEIGNTGSATVVWGLLAIAIFIILIAWVNYINLATARSLERAREVGVKKVLGSTKRQLIWQFMAESVLVNMSALALALLLVTACQPAFNHLLQHHLSLSYLFMRGLNGYIIPVCIVLVILSGIFVSGFYPAFVLSSFKPALVLKGQYGSRGKGAILRKTLVIAQFTITAILIAGSLVVYRQIRYMNDQQLGMKLDQILVIKPPMLTPWDSTFIDRANTFKNDIRELPAVRGISFTNRLPGDELGRTFGLRRTGTDPSLHYTSRVLNIDADFLNVYQVKLDAGRNFNYTDFNPDFDKLHTLLLNETAVKMLGFTSAEEAVGKTVEYGNRPWEVAGVLADYHQKSLRFPMEPGLFLPAYGNYNPISIKVSPIGLRQTLASIRTKYNASFPGNFFDYSFIDERFNAQYSNDILFGRVFGIFAGFAIFVACMGLFGLSLYSITRRTKEVGVRKVLGASVSNIVVLFSADFLKLILAANILAIPVAALVMHHWLQNYAYHIPIGWGIFVPVVIVSVGIAAVTISVQAIRAAGANPAKSLRTE